MSRSRYEATLRDAEAERANLRERIKRLNRIINDIKALLSRETQDTGPMPRSAKTVANRHPGRFAAASGPKAAETVLREEGEPLHLNQIVKRILEGGHDSTKKKLRNSLYTNMQRKPHVFYRVPDVPATFGLTEWRSGTEPEQGRSRPFGQGPKGDASPEP